LCLALALMAGASNSSARSAPGYDALITRGNSLLQAGNDDQALNSGEAAIGMKADRWEGYALAGSALMHLKRYEDAADALSKAIERAPESQQHALRDLRRQCLLAESGYPAVASPSLPSNSSVPPSNTSVLPPNTSVPSSNTSVPPPNTSVPPSNTSVPATTSQAEAPSHLADTEEQQVNERKRLVVKLTWADPATHLMWAKYSRPSEYSHANYTRATDYCAALRSLGYADWRLPTAVEFTRIYHFTAESAAVHLDGGLAANEEILRYLGFWTSTLGQKDGEHILVFEGKSISSRDNDGAGRVGGWLAGHPWNGAIVCVRDRKTADQR
jgi:tetratricopeptide (TPR) repeat protein